MKKGSTKGRGTSLNPKNRFIPLYIDSSAENFSEDELPGLFEEISGQKPTMFFHDNARSILSENDSYDLIFNYSLNPYKGCEHGCVYCYARPAHEYLGFSSGIDFETKIFVKTDAPELLEKTFRSNKWQPEMIAFSGNTDCYQPVERKLKLTRKCLEVCLKYRNPAGIVTKSSLVERDIDIFCKMAGLNLVQVMISVTTLNKELGAKLEPRASSVLRRLDTIEFLSSRGIPTGVFISPVIPGLNDQEIPAILKAASERGAVMADYGMLRLPYSVKDIFLDWLMREMPDKSSKIINRILEVREGKLNDSEIGRRFEGTGITAQMIKNLFEISCRRYNLNKRENHFETKHFTRPDDNPQLSLF